MPIGWRACVVRCTDDSGLGTARGARASSSRTDATGGGRCCQCRCRWRGVVASVDEILKFNFKHPFPVNEIAPAPRAARAMRQMRPGNRTPNGPAGYRAREARERDPALRV